MLLVVSGALVIFLAGFWAGTEDTERRLSKQIDAVGLCDVPSFLEYQGVEREVSPLP
jgi:hypothetical protein